MSFNGSGAFTINSAGQPVVTGTTISSTVFNALTADLATGLSTCITRDGQSATTARIPFANGISSTLTTDATSTTTGSILTAGGISAQKALWIGGLANIAGAATLQSTLAVTGATTLSAALTYGGVALSNAVTGTGNMVLSASPTLTGTLTAAIANFSGAVAANAGLVIAASQALTGTVANSTISGFLSVAATTGTFTNVGGTLSTATQNSVTTMTGLVTVGALNSGSITSGFGSIDVGADAISGGAITGTTGLLSSYLRLLTTSTSGLGVGDLAMDNGGARGGIIYFRNNANNAYIFGMYADTSDRVQIGSDSTGVVKLAGTLVATATTGVAVTGTLSASGAPSFPYVWATTGGTTTVMVDSAGTLFKLASSRVYKESFEPYTKGLETVAQLAPVLYRLKSAKGQGPKQAGFIAEDFDALGLSEFIGYGPDGPDSINYGMMATVLVNAIMQQQAQIDALRDGKKPDAVKVPSKAEIAKMIKDYEPREIASTKAREARAAAEKAKREADEKERKLQGDKEAKDEVKQPEKKQ